MKIRMDFVTNSGSSSFVIVNKVDKCNKLIEQFKDEYGKYGINLLNSLLVSSEQLNEWLKNCDDECIEIDGRFWYVFDEEYIEQLKEDVENNPHAFYLFAEVFLKDTESGGVFSSDDVWLLDHIPDNFLKEVFETEADW